MGSKWQRSHVHIYESDTTSSHRFNTASISNVQRCHIQYRRTDSNESNFVLNAQQCNNDDDTHIAYDRMRAKTHFDILGLHTKLRVFPLNPHTWNVR